MEKINLNKENKLLKTQLLEDFICVNSKNNPISKQIQNLSKKEIEYIISQYSLFPKKITFFLQIVRDRAKKLKFKEIEVELTRNLGEELGTQSGGISHYNILINGIKEEFNLEILDIEASNSTFNFLNSMDKILSNQNIFYILGGIYATEMSANPELKIVLDLVNELSQKTYNSNLKEGNLKYFFKNHIEIWEPGHEEELFLALKNYIKNKDNLNYFKLGFKEVLKTMDSWWLGLSKEINYI